MKIENTFIEGLKVIRLDRFTDLRGSFLKVFNADFFAENNLDIYFRESYFSVSCKNVIRGMHFQVPPFEHAKLVFLNQGAITDAILDIRKNSPTFGRFFIIEISEDNPAAVYIPVGCAHGFLSKTDHTMVTYLQTTVYNPDTDKGIKYNSFGFDWGVLNPIVSERDINFPEFNDYKTIFE
jgi:dTDP-4-dehydrorhamnose 3,5-epimerase